MELRIKPSSKKNYAGIEVEYRGEVIDFKGAGTLYCGGNDVNIFESFNEYLKVLSADVKDELFNCYQECKNILDPTPDENGVFQDEELLTNNNNYHYLVDKLRPLIYKIIKLINPSNLENYVTQNGQVSPPKDLTTNYSRGEFPKETTIDEGSYRDIARLVFLLRSVLPVISEMLIKAEAIGGKDYKEVVTGNLVNENPLIMTHPGWKKIFEYVDYSYNAPNKTTNPLRLELITKDQFAKHAAYKALFSRLSFAHIPSLVPAKNLAKILSSIVKQFDDPSAQVKEKPSHMDENAQKRSVYEICQLKENVNATEEMAQAEYFSFGLYDEDDNMRTKNRFTHQCAGLGIKNPDLVDYCFDLIPDLWDFELMPHMVKLMQLVFAGNTSYNIVYALEHQQLMPALALAQAKLHEMGYPNLSLLMTAIPDSTALRFHAAEMFSLNIDERKEIEVLCDVYAGKGETITDNEAVSSTMNFFKGLTLHGWKSTIEYGLLADPKAMSTAIRGTLYEIELSKDFKTEFLDLIQRINNPNYVAA